MFRFLSWMVCVLLLCGCSAVAPAGAAVTPAVEGALFQVIRADGSAKAFTVEELKQLPLGQLTVEGKIEEGPRLADVLQAAGVSEYRQLVISGSSSPVTLTREQVGDSLLDFTNHGTVKLATTAVPKPQWTKDVSVIQVQ